MKIAIVLLALCAALVYCDLPVHCEFPQVRGRWRFALTGTNYTTANIFSECGYSSEITVSDVTFISLHGPNVAVEERSGAVGNWTLLQDQGFELAILGNKYLAFFNYTTTEANKYVTNCSRTLTGWFHENTVAPKRWGCFRAERVMPEGSNDVAAPQTSKLEIPRVSRIFKNSKKFVDAINKKQKSWQATTYDFLEGKPIDELLHSSFSIPRNEESNLARSTISRAKISSANLPVALDWRNVSGVNYVSPVRDQKSCGSCFAFAGLALLEARSRIASKMNFQPIFAPQEIVSCSKYSQGCSGGDAYLVAKYAQDFGVVAEDCAPYQGKDLPCDNKCADPKVRTYVSSYSYVGGYYGATNEQNMMESIVNGGPVTIGFYVYRDFMNYKSGVYHHVTLEGEEEHLQNGPDPVYYPTSHAVLIVGYGVTESGEKYWICKNSWSSKWGMEGYFLIRRGTNESNCETKAVEATVIFQ